MSVWLPSPNHEAGRAGVKVDHVVLHWIVGDLAAADATFARSSAQVSAHYGVEGTVVHQYVSTADTAWHAGTRAENHRSIGIEHSAQPGRNASAATIATSVALIASLCQEYGISPDHIYRHKVFTPTQCPGTLPVEAMVAAVRAKLGGAAVKPVVYVQPKASGRVLLAVDGIFGSSSKRAAQSDLHVTADGLWGHNTITALQRRVGSPADGIQGPRTIRALQARLHVVADGSWGRLTTMAYQRKLNTGGL